MPDVPVADAVKDASAAVTAPAAASPAPAATGTPSAPAGASTAPAAQSGTPAAAAPAAKPADKPADAPAAPARPKTLIVEDEPAAAEKPADKAAEPAKVEEVKPADWKLEAPKDAGLDPADVAALDKSFKSVGLDKTKAQALLNEHAAMQKAQVNRAYEVWHDEAMKDPEIGGEKMTATLANVKRALGAFATTDERKAIANSPFANNPLFLRILNRAAAALPTEDATKVVGGQPVGKQMPTNLQEAINLMYPKKA